MHTLVLDLDETLVFSTLDPVDDPDFVLELEGQTIYVRVRPHTQAFLEHVQGLFQCRVWSTGVPVYVAAIAERLGIAQMELWARDKCRRLETPVPGHSEPYDKPLELIEPDLSTIVILDNSPGVFACNPPNGIHIATWRGEREDWQLGLAGIYLAWLATQPDVRRDHSRWTAQAMLLRNASGERGATAR